MARGRVAVEAERSGGLQHAAQLDQPRRHHRKVGEHVRSAEHGAEGAHGVRDLPARLDDLLVGLPGVRVPLPSVRERLNLGRGLLAVLLEQQVVGGV